MVPQMLLCPLAALGITGIYIVWFRFRAGRAHVPNRVLRERVAYMLWIAAARA
jgi:hypothetical protein